MSKLAVSVSMIKQDHPDHCTGIKTFYDEETDSLGEFSAQIASQIGKPVALTYRGFPVNRNAQLNQYAPASAKTLRFSATYKEPILYSEHAFQVHIHFYDGQRKPGDIMTVTVKPNACIGALEKVIQARRGIDIVDQRLLFEGRRMGRYSSFAEYEIMPNDIIECVPPQIGGWGAAFVDVSDSSNLQVIRFSTEAPDWRIATPGINVEGVCTNSSCEAYRHMVIARVGMVSWSLLEDPASCPLCKQDIEPMTCAFSQCQWIYDGCKTDENGEAQDVVGCWQSVDRQYHRFQVEICAVHLHKLEQGSQAEWQMLVLSARPLPQWKTKAGCEFCPVCHQKPLCQKESVNAACGHRFHTSCLTRWNKSQLSATGCPVCFSAC